MLFPQLECYKISMREAIDEDILPDPEVFLIPLELSNNIIETMVINPKAKKTMKASFSYRFMARKDKMDVALEIAIGSSLQIILFVAPILIFLSLFSKRNEPSLNLYCLHVSLF